MSGKRERMEPRSGGALVSRCSLLHCCRFSRSRSLSHRSRLSAQFPDEEAEDSASADSAAADTFNTTERYLREQAEGNVRVPVLPFLRVEGPRPALTRIVFTRDSIEWGHAATLGDLLTQVPGVYLWRGGYIGRPEPVNFQARGASSVEYFLDGMPYVAAGIDSVAVDPVLISLVFLDRIEVERWPGQLRVHLFTRRNDRLGRPFPDRHCPGRQQLCPLRRRAGASLHIGSWLYPGRRLSELADPGGGRQHATPTLSSGRRGVITPRSWVGLQYQLIRTAPNRRPFVINDAGVEDTIGPGYKAKRTDAQLRLSMRKELNELGPRADIIYSHSSWDSDSLDQQIDQLGGLLSYRTSRFSLGGSAFHRTRWTPLDARINAGLNPVGPFSASAELVHLKHFGGRASDYATLAAGLEPLRGLALTGSARLGKMVAAPSILTDPEQDVHDLQAALGWSRARLGFQVSYARTSAFSPLGYADFPEVPQIGPSSSTEWITASVRIAPLQWLTLESWYSDPVGDVAPEGLPPTHSVNAATIRSKFLRQFPSGIFDLKLRLSLETWGTGVIGRDSLGAPIELHGATFLRSLIQVQLDRFYIYWDRTNLGSTALTYVPGFRIPSYGSNFGVRWEFEN